MSAWDMANPYPPANIADMADHIDHVRKIAGIDAIGIGGDYDGIPFAPEGLEEFEDGDTLAVSAYNEDSNQTTITNGTTASSNNSSSNSGAGAFLARASLKALLLP